MGNSARLDNDNYLCCFAVFSDIDGQGCGKLFKSQGSKRFNRWYPLQDNHVERCRSYKRVIKNF